MADKLMSAADAVAQLKDGMTLGIGGWGPRRKPMAVSYTHLDVYKRQTYNDTSDEDSAATHAGLMRQAATLGLAYLHVMRAPVPDIDAFALARQHFGARVIVNDGFDGASAEQALASGQGDAVSFARHYIGNPDLVRRLREGLPLARFDRKTLYTPGEAGYSDYPACAGAAPRG